MVPYKRSQGKDRLLLQGLISGFKNVKFTEAEYGIMVAIIHMLDRLIAIIVSQFINVFKTSCVLSI